MASDNVDEYKNRSVVLIVTSNDMTELLLAAERLNALSLSLRIDHGIMSAVMFPDIDTKA